MPVVTCPGCAVKLKVPDGLSAAAKCPKCRAALTPPAPPAFEVVDDAPQAPPRPAPGPRPTPKPASKPDLAPVDDERPERSAVRKRQAAEIDERDDEDDRPRKKPRRKDDDEDDVEDAPKRGKKRSGADRSRGGNRGLLLGGLAVGGLVFILVGVLGVRYVMAEMAFGGKWPEPEPPKSKLWVAAETVTLRIRGADDVAAAEAISERLFDMAADRHLVTAWADGRMTVLFSPVKDAEAFAKEINVGRVHSVKGTVICVYADKLEALPTDPVAKAVRTLGRPAPAGKMSALMTLSQTRPDDRRAEVLKAVEPLLDDADAMRRGEAGNVYCAWATVDNIATVIKLLKNDNARVRAVEALARFKDERAIVPLTECMGHFSGQGEAKAALIAFGPAAEDAVIKLLDNSERNVRLLACEMLIKIGSAKCLPALERTAKDRDRSVNAPAKNAILQINQRLSSKS
ncbi:HEAT repeat domain-containing protein [Frigoriglobus tundricola]|uniref:HEAT repeat domain-containing protein n=1 Tax=Frigoriglobus tundricola TaxID=2774151 RepID=A0A6M5Z115_9BACT|nr:HEAT repeat domain-containing protein [Frigoriglobus tundricola]QJW99855.1 hypothetical protein FTUN_7478 [Frigoriglobus tundricola]